MTAPHSWSTWFYVTGLCTALVIGAGCGSRQEDAATAATSPEPTLPAEVEPKVPSQPEPRELRTVEAEPMQESEGPASPPTPADEAFAVLTREGVSAEEWEAAYRTLGELGPEAAPVLRKGLKSPAAHTREWSASLIATNPGTAELLASELRQALEDESGFVRANAAAALVLVPGQEQAIVPVFIELVQSPDVDLRRLAAMNLASLDVDAASHLDALIVALDDQDPETRRILVELIGRMGPAARAAVPRLRQISGESTDAPLQSAIQQAVAEIEATPEQ